MSHVRRINGTFRPNFLESEVGLVLKTYQISASLGTEDEFGNKIVAAGTVYPSNDGSAVGIVFEDVDVTWGDHEGSIMLAGRVLKDRLDVQSAAETPLKSSGIVFVDAPEVTRGYTVTYEKDDGTGTPPGVLPAAGDAPGTAGRGGARRAVFRCATLCRRAGDASAQDPAARHGAR